jgi:hypothetical protein
VTIYWGTAGLLALLPGRPLGLRLHPAQVGLSALAYVVFATDYVASFASYQQSYQSRTQREALLAGVQTGTLTLKLMMMVIWYVLFQMPLLVGLMLLFAIAQLLKVAEFRVSEAADWPPPARGVARVFQVLVIVPNRLFLPLTRRTVHPPDPHIESKLTTRALFDRAREIPRLTMHDMLAFIPFYRELSIVEFGVGALLGNLLVSALVVVWPARTTYLLRHPATAIGICAGFLALTVLCGVRFVSVAHLILARR